MTRCDREEGCTSPRSPVRWLSGESIENRAHVMCGSDFFNLFHPECCPGQVLGVRCFRCYARKRDTTS